MDHLQPEHGDGPQSLEMVLFKNAYNFVSLAIDLLTLIKGFLH